MRLLAVALTLSLAGFAAAFAQTATPDSENGRYSFNPVADGVLRLDTVTTFDWDEVSVIAGHGDLAKASQCLGISATDDTVTGEDIATVVFVHDHAIARTYRSPRPPFLYPLVPFQPGPCRVSRERASFKVTLDADGRHQLVLVEQPAR